MDTLHPIAPSEQLIAQGEYNYQVIRKDSGLKEDWALHCLPEGILIHRAVVRGRIAGLQLEQITHYVMTSAYRPITLEMTQNIDGQLAQTQLDCLETFICQSITTENYPEDTGRSAGQNATVQTEVEVPAGYRVFFPPVSAQGLIAQSYNFDRGGKQILPLVSIRIHPENALPLSIEVQHIAYEHIDSNHEIETPAGQFMCHHLVRYDQHMEQQLWVDENWITVQWSVPYSEIMKWEYLLTRYHRE